ncbi:MAG: helix-turn-helix transcriptional regulator [Saccharothrix sp.]|nr:helix-turn-helix transcriptional regulator [Saccharothrix sp.]
MAGFVLKLSRQAAGLTQEKLAELLDVDPTTVQGWESGRRPLAAVGAGEVVRLSARLSRAGAPASTGRHLNEAIEADLVLSTGIAAGGSWVDPDHHPLASAVHRKTTTNLVTWPFTGNTPPQLGEFISAVPRRGPVASRPLLRPDEQSRFFDHLRHVVERADHAKEPLLRRQSVYLLGFDRREEVIDWLRDEWHRVSRRAVSENHITGLLEARSASVALASTGEREHIDAFVSRMSSAQDETANLNYWAYWIGELRDVRVDDSFMRDEDTRTWDGSTLLTHLVTRLDPTTPHLPLNLHTLHTLVASRPSLLDGRPRLRTALAESLDELASGDALSHTGRDEVAGLRYALRISERH